MELTLWGSRSTGCENGLDLDYIGIGTANTTTTTTTTTTTAITQPENQRGGRFLDLV